MYAYYHPPRNGQPWLDIDDARLIEDWLYGCSLFTMAKRALRSEEEVEARLAEMGYSMDRQPKGRKIRDITWRRH